MTFARHFLAYVYIQFNFDRLSTCLPVLNSNRYGHDGLFKHFFHSFFFALVASILHPIVIVLCDSTTNLQLLSNQRQRLIAFRSPQAFINILVTFTTDLYIYTWLSVENFTS